MIKLKYCRFCLVGSSPFSTEKPVTSDETPSAPGCDATCIGLIAGALLLIVSVAIAVGVCCFMHRYINDGI